ncbi:hypothetical protein CKO_03840 [Citrobacter koseri ATCC BAA-895]|uniref:Uncharacterized protein n=1 Tax=Citrobacter koseri (strain ATCC BAA-895 / CDC 4225-83 / SGSC4696) TaxID=290338 RepID=A8AN53_CITK8|nr:hypothetical protein CKO_03840 [Citrobacter koseri ATCC BAA-895]
MALCLPGRQNLSPVGRIRRLCRHPASCPVALCLPGLQNLSPVGRIRRLRRHPALCRWRFAYRAYKIHSRRLDKALAPPSGVMPGGASLTGPTKFTPVGRIRRLRRHPASCLVALRLPGRQNLSPVGRIRRLRRHPAPCRWRFAYRAYKIHSRRPDKALAPPSGAMPGGASLTGPTKPLSRRPDKALTPPSVAMPGGASLTGPTKFTPVGRIRCLCRHPALCPVALHLPGRQNSLP